jgi:hypothetical protein
LEGRPIEPQQIDDYVDVAGRITVDQQGVRSEIYGTLDFMTPIVELDLDQVTESESKNYVLWRQQYEQKWRRTFDPIAIQFKATPETWSADVTVMPLAVQSQYSFFVELTRGAKINAQAIDAHAESLMHFAMSIDKNSAIMSIARTMLESRLPAALRTDPLGWMGSTIEVYVDDDPVWNELPIGQFYLADAFEHELPVAIGFEVIDGLKLIPFLIALRAFIDQIAPDMMIWETRRHHSVSYTRIGTNPDVVRRSGAGIFGSPALYYAVTGDKLCISLNERCLQRAIDRAATRRDVEGVEKTPEHLATSSAVEPLLGENVTLNLTGDYQTPLRTLMEGANYVAIMRTASWSNLPILNEWKRRMPDADPVELHHKFWGRHLHCRGGGQYRWREQEQSMESSIFGPPGTPIATDHKLPIPMDDLDLIDFGVTFEHGGLRARMEMKRK